jgi:hypothetical protein
VQQLSGKWLVPHELRKALTAHPLDSIFILPGRDIRTTAASTVTRIWILNYSVKIQMPKPNLLTDTCAVELRVELPRALAAEVAEVQREDPAMLSRILLYGLTRRAIYDGLSRRGLVDEVSRAT